jgi:hypothetical protein
MENIPRGSQPKIQNCLDISQPVSIGLKKLSIGSPKIFGIISGSLLFVEGTVQRDLGVERFFSIGFASRMFRYYLSSKYIQPSSCMYVAFNRLV